MSPVTSGWRLSRELQRWRLRPLLFGLRDLDSAEQFRAAMAERIVALSGWKGELSAPLGSWVPDGSQGSPESEDYGARKA